MDELNSMALNEIGDFFAGLFGPLAILWLVLGFFQQGRELRQNTEALELQAEELANSVRQQEELVDITWQQFEFSKEAIESDKAKQQKLLEPKFVISGFGASISNNYKLSCNLINTGATAINVTAIVDANEEIESRNRFTIWKRDDNKKLEFVFDSNRLPKKIKITMTYSNEQGTSFERNIEAICQSNSQGRQVYVLENKNLIV